MKYLIIVIITLALGVAIGRLGIQHPPTQNEHQPAREILYWVAPMDSSYRREAPGKSPMGMDLIPVYADDAKTNTTGVDIPKGVQQQLNITTAVAAYRNISPRIEAVGFVAFNEDKLIHVHPRVKGWIEDLSVTTEGQSVTQNQTLYTLYSPELVNAQEELVLALSRKNPSLIAAAEAKLNALNIPSSYIEGLKQGKKVSQHIAFPAPQSGIVANLNIRPGFFVEPGTTMMAIANLDEVWILADVFERQADQISVGQTAKVTFDALPSKNWQAEVDYIYPIIDGNTRSLKVRFRMHNPNGLLKPNMLANLTLNPHSDKPVLSVPANAVIRTHEQSRVVIQTDDKQFQSVAVTTGLITHDFIEVTKGLNDGDRVVTQAQFLIDSESDVTTALNKVSAGMPDGHHDMAEHTSTPEPSLPTATVMGVVNSIDADNHVINISRGAIEKWDRGPATMDFSVAHGVSLAKISEGQEVHFTFVIDNGEFIVTHIMPMSMESHGAHQHD